MAISNSTDKPVGVQVTPAIPQTVLECALAYARRGWRVFPAYTIVETGGFGVPYGLACSCRLGAQCPRPGKHPRTKNGFQDATLDPKIIQSWPWYSSNVAIATGRVSGIWVMDVDPANCGVATLAQLGKQHGFAWKPYFDELIRRCGAITGGKGAHFYFKYPKQGGSIGSGTGTFGPGIDQRGDGGYVLAPPSAHFSGGYYFWKCYPSDPAQADSWVLRTARACRGTPPPRGSSSSAAPGDSRMLTRDHPLGQKIAKVLEAKDCGSSWKFDCPCGGHETPDCRMYPKPGNQLLFKCFSSNPHSHREMLAAVGRRISNKLLAPITGARDVARERAAEKQLEQLAKGAR